MVAMREAASWKLLRSLLGPRPVLPALQVLTISVWPFVEQQGEILEETTMLATEIRSRWHAHWRKKLSKHFACIVWLAFA